MRYLRILPFLLALFFLSITSPVPERQHNVWAMSTVVPQEVRDTKAAVFNFLVNGETDCTGFAVKTATGKDLITAGHCAEGLNPTDVITVYHQATQKSYKVKLKAFKSSWPTDDYSIWTFLGTQPPVGLPTTTELPAEGDEVFAVIGTRGLVPFITNGIYAGPFQLLDDPKNEKNGMAMITVPGAAPGASGSPVFDSKGRVWGILVGGNPYFPGISLVVRVP